MKAQVVALVNNAEGLPAKSIERALGKYGRAYAIETLATDAGKLAEALADAEIVLTHGSSFKDYPELYSWIRSLRPLIDVWQICPAIRAECPHEGFDECLSHAMLRDRNTKPFHARLDRRLKQKEVLRRVGMVGRSQRMGLIAETIERVAPTDVSVLISGPTGSGKEKIAHAIHELSARSKGPFVAVNCGAIPEGLIESELFGHERGAFTGSVSKRAGYFAQADGGTIFLDEIGEMRKDMQVKLLRALEEGVFYPLGSEKPHSVNVRTIAASNRNLEDEIMRGAFRDDLYFRLAGVKITAPALSDRREDIVPLLATFSEDSGLTGYSPEALELIEEYHWPGNVRQLRNFVTRMSALHGRGEVVGEDVRRYIAEQGFASRALPVVSEAPQSEPGRDLMYRALIQLGAEVKGLRELMLSHINGEANGAGAAVYDEAGDEPEAATLSLEDMEARLFEEALRASGGNRREAARRLGIGERTLYRKMKKYGLK